MAANAITLSVLAGIDNRIQSSSNAACLIYEVTGTEFESREYFKNLAIGATLIKYCDIISQKKENKPLLLNQYQSLYIAGLTMGLANAILSSSDEIVLSKVIWDFLYASKPVYIELDSLFFRNGERCKNDKLNNLISETKLKLLSLGILTWPEKQIENSDISKKEIIEPESIRGDYSDYCVLLEKDIIGLKRGSIIKLPVGVIITPLAKDYISRLDISIQWI